jgi:PilZ domain
MTDQNELIGIFSNLASGKKPVMMYNTYRGLPFNYEADVLAVEQGSVSTRVHQHQAISMALEGRTHLHNRNFPEVIRANVVDVDLRKKQAILSEFVGVGDAVGKRTKVRVQPSETLEAEISDGRRWIRGRIADLSASGMCIFTFSASMYASSFNLDREVFIDFTPPSLDTVVRFMGVITNVSDQEGSYLHRLGLKIFPNPEIQPLLEEYIAIQQQTILREMEQTYQSMTQEH